MIDMSHLQPGNCVCTLGVAAMCMELSDTHLVIRDQSGYFATFKLSGFSISAFVRNAVIIPAEQYDLSCAAWEKMNSDRGESE